MIVEGDGQGDALLEFMEQCHAVHATAEDNDTVFHIDAFNPYIAAKLRLFWHFSKYFSFF